MVLIKWPCAPDDIEAKLAASISTTSSTLSIATMKQQAETSQPVITINVHLRCTASTRSELPITLQVHGLIFDNMDTGLDVLAQGRLSWLVATNAIDTDGKPKRLSLGMLRLHYRHFETDDNEDLRKWPLTSFLTVPSLDSGEEVVVSFPITCKRPFEHGDTKTPEYFKPGEKYNLGLQEGYMGATWWSWGGLKHELKDRKLNIYSKGWLFKAVPKRKPTDQEIDRENWTMGEDISHLQFVCEDVRHAMVIIKRRFAPEDEDTRIAVSLTIEPRNVSIAAMHPRVAAGVDDTVFYNTETGLDSLAQGRIGPLVLCNRSEGDPPKGLSFGIMRVRHRYVETSDTVDLRYWPDTAVLTVPAMSEQRDAVVDYPITTERLFEHSDGKGPDYFRAGELYRLSLHEGYVGALWWCWGDLDGDLRDKKLNVFQQGGHTKICPLREPSVGGIKREKLVLGEEIAHLQFDCEGGRSYEVTIVE
nr:hypothetical protein B0A51_05227 [Rachicladosporium sp. CCFEE 5018]